MKKLMFLLMIFVGTMTLSSCVATAHAQDSTYVYDDVEVSVVLQEGVPYYYEGHIAYWVFNNWYYYRYWYDGYWTYYRYRKPLPMHRGWRFVPQKHHKPVYRHKPNIRRTPPQHGTIRRNIPQHGTVRRHTPPQIRRTPNMRPTPNVRPRVNTSRSSTRHTPNRQHRH